jgi:hypothetical protein
MGDLTPPSPGMPQLPWRDLSAVGEGQETGARQPFSKCTGLALSLLPLQADISALPGRGRSGGSDAAAAEAGGLDVGVGS